MLTEALAALAAAGGTAVVQAAGTDVWTSVRDRVIKVFSRGDDRQARQITQRLDQTATALESAGKTEADGEEARIRLTAAWQARFEDLLEGADDRELADLVIQVRQLAALTPHTDSSVSASDGAVAVGGDVRISAHGGSVAANVIRGGVKVENPSLPGPDQG